MVRRLIGLLALAAALLGPASAFADDCNAVAQAAGKQLIIVAGSSALGPFLKVMGPKLADQAGLLLAYTGNGSCNGVNGALDPTANPLAAGATLTYVPADYAGGAGGTPPTCTLGAATPIDLGMSDVFVETCTRAKRPADIGDFSGPAQAMTFVVPAASSQSAITAEEAYFAFGFGGAAGKQAPPWVDPTFFYIRPDSSGTLRILAAAIGVPNEKWAGQRKNDAGKDMGSGDVLNKVKSSTNADGTIGILGMDVVDAGTNRQNVKVLAFKAYGQKFAYYPDSTSTSYDKINLREGRYAGLGYAHLVAKVDTSGVPTNAKAKKFIDIVLGNEQLTGVDMIKTLAQDAHLIPHCAMKVQRSAEGGDLSLYKPAKPCGCYFSSIVATAPASCTACTSDAQCGSTASCSYGFCEAK